MFCMILFTSGQLINYESLIMFTNDLFAYYTEVSPDPVFTAVSAPHVYWVQRKEHITALK